jgi:hypothetical protein
VPELQITEDEMSKNFREMNDSELKDKIKQVQRSREDAMANIDGENIKEVSNSNQPRGTGTLGTRNQNVVVGMKRCVKCRFELPGYETICVACKAHQPVIQKP